MDENIKKIYLSVLKYGEQIRAHPYYCGVVVCDLYTPNGIYVCSVRLQ
jgi:hypothetical protein